MKNVIFIVLTIFSTNLYALEYNCTVNLGGAESVSKTLDFSMVPVEEGIDRFDVIRLSKSASIHQDSNSNRNYTMICGLPITENSICNISVMQIETYYGVLEIPRTKYYKVANVIFKAHTDHIGYNDHLAQVFLGCDLQK